MARLRWLACAITAVLLTVPRISRADEAAASSTAGSVTWTPGRLSAPALAAPIANEEEDRASLALYESSAAPKVASSPTRSHAFVGTYGLLGTFAYGGVSVASWEHLPWLGPGLAGAAVSTAGLFVGAVAAPSSSTLDSELAEIRHATNQADLDPAEGAQLAQQALARAAARERTVRKVTSTIVIAGGAATLAAGAGAGVENHRGQGKGVGSVLLALGALHTIAGLTDLVRPWQIERRYEHAKMTGIASAQISATPVAGGAMVQVGGSF